MVDQPEPLGTGHAPTDDRLELGSPWRKRDECCGGYEYVLTWGDGDAKPPLQWPDGQTMASGITVAPSRVLEVVFRLRAQTDIDFPTLMVRCARCGQWHP
jgi:hypothetical protein